MNKQTLEQYRNQGGSISPEIGEVMLVLVGIGTMIYMVVFS